MILMVEVIVDLSRLDKFGPKMPEIRRMGLGLVAQDMQRTADIMSPIDEGHLHKWFIANASDSQYTIKSPAHYVGFVNYGTGPIRAKNKKALHWEKGGVDYFAKSTKGQKGQHFIEKAITEVTPRIDDHFKTAIASVLK